MVIFHSHVRLPEARSQCGLNSGSQIHVGIIANHSKFVEPPVAVGSCGSKMVDSKNDPLVTLDKV